MSLYPNTLKSFPYIQISASNEVPTVLDWRFTLLAFQRKSNVLLIATQLEFLCPVSMVVIQVAAYTSEALQIQRRSPYLIWTLANTTCVYTKLSSQSAICAAVQVGFVTSWGFLVST